MPVQQSITEDRVHNWAQHLTPWMSWDPNWGGGFFSNPLLGAAPTALQAPVPFHRLPGWERQGTVTKTSLLCLMITSTLTSHTPLFVKVFIHLLLQMIPNDHLELAIGPRQVLWSISVGVGGIFLLRTTGRKHRGAGWGKGTAKGCDHRRTLGDGT